MSYIEGLDEAGAVGSVSIETDREEIVVDLSQEEILKAIEAASGEAAEVEAEEEETETAEVEAEEEDPLKQVCFRVPTSLHKAFRVACVASGTKMTSAAANALRNEIARLEAEMELSDAE